MSGSTTKGFNVNLTDYEELPDMNYINELAREKNFQFSSSFAKAPPILEDLYYLYSKEREEAEEFDYKNHLFSKSTVEEYLEREMTESEKAYYVYTLKFLEGLAYSSCPGFSPMDKALNTIMYLSYLSEKEDNSSTNSNENNSKTIDPAALNDAIQSMSDGIKPPGEEGKGSKDGKELSKDIISCVRDFLYDLSPSIAHIYAKERVDSIPINTKMLRDIKIKAYLEEKVNLSTSLDKKLVENNSSRKKQSKLMTSYGQVMKTNKTQMILPNFNDKLVKKELTVREKVKPEEKKQMLTMLLDDSGSMSSLAKQSYVRAVLMNRLESVIDGKSKLNFYLYESKRYGKKEITNLKQAQDLYKDISLRSPNGGGTNIGLVLQETVNEIHNVPGYHHPEIMIVCDGDKT